MIDDEYDELVQRVKDSIRDIQEDGDELDLEEIEKQIRERLERLRRMLELGGGDVFHVEKGDEGVCVEPFERE